VEKSNIDLNEIRSEIAGFLTQFEGVKIALPAQILEQGGSDNGALAGLYRNYMYNRSGDVLYILNEGWQPVYKFKKVNYTDQIHIPAVFYGAGIQRNLIRTPHEAIDMAVTLSEILRIPPPDKSRGRVIEGI
jgi:arylsulfatase A-like enzyme